MYLRKFALIALFGLLGSNVFASDRAEIGQTSIDIPYLIEQSTTINDPDLKQKMINWYQNLPEDSKDTIKDGIEVLSWTAMSSLTECMYEYVPNGKPLIFFAILTAQTAGQKIGHILNKIAFKNIPVLKKSPTIARCGLTLSGYLSGFAFNVLVAPVLGGPAYQFYVAFITTVALELAQHLRATRDTQ